MKPVRAVACLASLFVLCTAFAIACGGAGPSKARSKNSSPAKAAPADPSVAEAKSLFESLCYTCHGLSGHGDGPGAAAIEPKPRSFADAVWQDSVTDEQIHKTIVFGGAAVGKSPMMPAQPQLKGKAEVLGALTKIVRGFRGK